MRGRGCGRRGTMGDDLDMPEEVSGLPLHVLLVHAVIVLIPIAALLTVLSAVWPAARRRLGIVTPLVGLVTLILVPITTNAGEWLLARVHSTPLIQEHADLGTSMIGFAVGLAGASVVQVVRVGEAGSRAVWTGSFCAEPLNADGSCPAA